MRRIRIQVESAEWPRSAHSKSRHDCSFRVTQEKPGADGSGFSAAAQILGTLTMAEALSPILPPEVEAATHRLLQAASERELKLATAESCTGGLIASLLTDVPGRSHVFERAFVTYSNEAKEQLLGVGAQTLAQHGPVSEEAVREMALGALNGSAADVVLAVTGWTEEGPAPNQPAGLVWFATARRSGGFAIRKELFGDIGRAAIRLKCLDVALEMFAGAISEQR